MVAFDFFNKNSKSKMNFALFNQTFPHFLRMTLGTIDWNLLWKEYDNKFKLMFVEDLKNNKILKIL